MSFLSMELEKEINQKNFRSEQQKGLVNIIFTYNWLKSHLTNHFKPFDITMQQFNVLRILNGQYPKPITTSVIRERMLDKMSDASRIVERLHKKGWVDRCKNNIDRRLVDVVITDNGRRLLQQIDASANDMDNMMRNLNKDEVEQLNHLLDKIRY